MAEGTRDLAEADPLVVRRSAEETGGEFVRFESTLFPSPESDRSGSDLPHRPWLVDNPGEHVHPEQEELFEVLSGEFRVVLEGTERTLTEGDVVTLPANVPHRHWNPTDRPIRVVQERRPARRTEELGETLYALAQAGETDEEGMPGLLQLAVTFDAYPDDTYPAFVPVGVQKALFSLLAPVGRLAGYEATRSREDVDDRR